MNQNLRLVAIATILASSYAGSVALSACSSNNPGTDGGTDASTDSGTKKDSGGVKDTGPVDDSGDDGAVPTLDPLCTAPVDAATNGACVTIDGTNFKCNPVNNSGCDGGAGEACDLGGNGFECFPAPNDVKLCGSCDNQNGPFCLPTMHCVATTAGAGCARYCCDDTDCTGGHCDLTILGGQAPGVCVK